MALHLKSFSYYVPCFQSSRKYRATSTLLDEKTDQLAVHKDEIKLLKMSIDGYETKVAEQSSLISKLEKQLTNVKGTLADSLLDEIQYATSPSPSQSLLKSPR